MDLYELENIAPYTDEEAVVALGKLAKHPNVPWISRFIFPDKPDRLSVL